MADQWEITYRNNKNGKKGTCTKDEWDALRRHPTLRGTCRLVSKRQIFTPTAAVEAEQNKAQQATQEPVKQAEAKYKNSKSKSPGRAPKTESQDDKNT